MAADGFDTYVFENGQFVPLRDMARDQMQWIDYLTQQGYAESRSKSGASTRTYM